MLQRAASNAYSWWWASHIRTKQSKWLEQNLQDMEDKVGEMIKIIDDDGDSFAQRAEMYYQKRPELINFVEASYRQYRALAERYDYLSKDLQSANRTIATVFPEQVQFAIDAEDEENQRITSTSTQFITSKSCIPKVPTMPKKDFRSPSMLMSRKGNLRRSASSARAALPPVSGLSKEEALEQMDTLQKGVLALQTEKEFVKSSYENGYERYWEIENRITEMQAKVCSLQDEFGIGTVIDDNEARTLMAATALKSCQDTLAKLQEQQEQSVGDARLQYQKIMEAHEKFANLRNQFLFKHGDQESGSELQEFNSEIRYLEEGTRDLELLRLKIKEKLAVDPNKSLTVSQLAEKVDEIVEKVVTLETAVSSQAALVKRLKSETDELHAKLQSLEEEKQSLIENVEIMSNKLNALEEELRRLRSLKQSMEDQNKDIQTQITEANCDIDNLCDTLQYAEIIEEVEDAGLFHKVKASSEDTAEKGDNEHEDQKDHGDGSIISQDTETNKEEKRNSAKPEGENIDDTGLSDKLDFMSEHPPDSAREEKDEKKYMSETASSSLYFEHEDQGMEDGEDTQNWRQLANGLEDRDKILLEEYTTVLRNYQDVKRKLGDVEKKNRDGFIDLALQIRELENAVAFRDAEIQSLRNKLQFPQRHMDENMDTHTLAESHLEGCQESVTQETISPVSNFSSTGFPQQPTQMSEQNFDFKERADTKKSPKWDDKQLKVKNVIRSSHVVPTIEEKIRLDIDALLEENLELWLRFSTSFHQIQKFQTGVQDLKAELSKLRDGKKQEGNKKDQSINSEARPIYKHLREIQTELTLWLENNAVLKDELHGRYSSLCGIQDEISRVSSTGIRPEETELSNYQAAKFQGEVINMKQENGKIAGELEAGLTQVRQLRMEVEKTLAKLEEELTLTASIKSTSSRTRIPLRSFLFGVKLKRKVQKPSLFSCMNPALQKQYSTLAKAGPPL
ncbi:hypothetical protein ACOSQ2_010634 [Xanthoceras sorbifolium]|uniref:NAB domain-containing protein n=1 Tax=Xanthoceras sorbifolium TaxID=99658 RepID=A0ABQ8HTL1_9ROSI|nr:hypothetical protein JRO89_XS07G0115400 [Xanthoceras sorbifolium]